jgi:Putative zinc-finger
MIHHLLGHLLSCRDVTRLVSQRQDGTLPRWKQIRLRMHLAVCDACTRFDAQMRFLRRAMRKYSG